MAQKTWPSSLPHEPLREGFDFKQRYTPNRTHETEQGPGRQRAVGGGLWTKLGYIIELTEQQALQADRFITVDLVQGSARFWMPVGRFYAPQPWPLRLCKITDGLFTLEPFGDRLTISFELNVLDW